MMARPGTTSRGAMRARPATMALVALALVGCSDEAPAVVRGFRFTAPVGAIEIVPVPGEPVAIAWTADADGDDLAVELTLMPVTPPGPTLALAIAALADGALTWHVPDPAPRAGIYQLGATVRDGDAVLATTTASTIVLMQGAEFRDPALAFTGAQPERDIWVSATTGTVLGFELFLADAATGPRQVLARGTIASDLAPIGRVFPFTGATVDGDPIPAGTHRGFLALSTRDGAVTYLRDGLTLTWAP